MGEKARAWVFNNLSEEAVIAQFVAMYADAISEHTGATIGQLRGGYSPVDHGESFTALGQGPPGEGSGGEPVGKSERSVAESTVSGATDRTLAHAEASPSVSRHDSSHVVHYLPQFRLEQGGVVRAVLDLCAALAAGGDRVTILTEDHADCPDSWKRESRGVPEIVRLRGTRGGNPVLSPWSMPVVRRVVTEADVVHLHGMWTPANLQIASVAIDFRVPYVISAHGMLDDWSMNQKRPKKLFHWYTYSRNLLQNAMQVHCTARAELDQARRWFPRGSGTVVPLIFDLAPYRALPGPDVARRAFPGAWSDRPTILYLSRVNYKKGPDVLIEAASRMASRGIDFTLLIAGPGDPPEYLDRMKSLAASRGIGDRTHFLGHVSGATKLSLYEASDVFALPTSQENFGFVFFEALACGTPVVTTPGVDVWRELKSSGGAEIVERDAEKFAESLSALLSADRAAPGSLRARGQSGRRWIFEHLEPSGIIGQFRKMYGIASAGA
jgi:glycosyltransferase involved in cell wall biosynthesis